MFLSSEVFSYENTYFDLAFQQSYDLLKASVDLFSTYVFNNDLIWKVSHPHNTTEAA